MSIAVFLLPKSDLNERIVYWKNRVQDTLINQPYTNHPPHLTILNVTTINNNQCLDIISNISSKIKPFKIKAYRTNVFWNDNLTGGHTLFFEIKKNNNLLNLQISIAKAISKMKESIPPPKKLRNNNIFLESYNKYGFPFVGDHWIPHFSISSMQTKKTHPIIKEFLSETKTYDLLVEQLSIWEIDEDDHHLLDEVSFQ